MTARVAPKTLPLAVQAHPVPKGPKEQTLGYKVAFVAGCIIGTPFVLAHDMAKASWEGIKWGITKLVDIAEVACKKVISYVYQVAKESFEWVCDKVLVPLGNALYRVAVWTYDEVIEPIATFVFETLPRLAYDYVLKPAAELAVRCVNWTLENIIHPILPTIRQIAQMLFIDVPVWVRKNLLAPLARTLVNVANWTHETIVRPLVQAIHKTACALFIDLPCFVHKTVIKPVFRWTVDNLITPAKIAISQIAHALFVKLPLFVYNNVIEPTANALYNGAVWTYDNVLTPAAERIGQVATTLYNVALVPLKNGLLYSARFTDTYLIQPLVTAVTTVATALFIDLPQFVHERLITPIATTVSEGAIWAYNTLVSPVAQKVAQIACDVIVTTHTCVTEYVVVPIQTGAQLAAQASLEFAQDVTATISQLFSPLFGVPAKQACA